MASTDGGSTSTTFRAHRGTTMLAQVGGRRHPSRAQGSSLWSRAPLWSATAAAFVLVLLATAGPAGAEPFDVESPKDVTIDLTTDTDPKLELELQRTSTGSGPAGSTEVVLSLAATTPLGTACDFIARDGLPTTVDATATVTFTIRDADRCDLTSLDVDEVTLSSGTIDDANIKATLKRDPKFPLAEYSDALRNSAAAASIVVLLSALVAWAWWAYKGKSGGRFWRHPLDSPTLTWSFNESWLTNLTALGALLATLLGLTDVLDIIGPKKPERAVFLLVNFAGLALAASSLIVYLALRGYKLKTTSTTQIPLRLQLRVEPGAQGNRKLTLDVPTVNYTIDSSGVMTRAPQLGHAGTREWTNSGQHLAVVAITATFTNTTDRPAPPPAFIALEVPSAGGHAPNAVLLYDTSIAELTKADPKDPKKYLPATTEESRTKAHGRMIGFVAAGLLASIGVAIQLAATYKVLDRAELSPGARQAGAGTLIVLVLCAVAYVVTTIVTRLPEVDSVEPTSEPAAASLPHQQLDTPTGKVGDPVAPAAILNASSADQIVALDAFDQITVTSPGDLGAIAYPTVAAYPITGTSPGDDRPARRRRGETAF